MKPSPHETPQARAARLAREEREAQALRENLRKRKQQGRDRQAPGVAPDPAPGSAGGSPSEPSTEQG